MKHVITINQFAAKELGLIGSLDIIDLALFDSFKSFANSSRCEKIIDENGFWFWVSYQLIIDELPFSGLNTKDAIYRRMKKLENARIIVFHPNNQRMNKTFFQWGKNYDAMERRFGEELPTDEKLKVANDLRMKNRRGTDEKPKVPTDEKPNNPITNNNPYTKPKILAENKFPQPNSFPVEDQKNENSPSIGAGPLRVTIIEGHEEILPPVKTKKARLPKEPGDHLIQQMVQVFEAEHKIHFKDGAGDWVGFTWQAKEFPALTSIRKELERRYKNKMNVDPAPENIVDSWAIFLRKAAACDRFILDNCFTPSKIWGQFQNIINKIHGGSTTPPKKSGSPNGFGGDMSKYAETQKF